jgi:AhpD family alkylhydroperoxidase
MSRTLPLENPAEAIAGTIPASTVTVYDPAMCCSSGVCGPSVDPQLARFAADLDWLAGQGVAVQRYNLSQQPGAFAADPTVRTALQERGDDALPLVQVNGAVRSIGVYPSRGDLATWAGVEPPAPSLFTEAVAELVAIGAAIAANCESCFRFHYDRARALGVSRDDMMLAVTTAQTVKEAPAQAVLALAERYLQTPAGEKPEPRAKQSAGCCEPAATAAPVKTKRCC